MTLRQEIEDALLDALESGLNPPKTFDIVIPDVAFARVAKEGSTLIHTAGFRLTLVPESTRHVDAFHHSVMR